LSRIHAYHWPADVVRIRHRRLAVGIESHADCRRSNPVRFPLGEGERKRVAEFNWTNNSNASTLVNEYRKAADQAILIFDISIARENQPLNAPKLMEAMESLLKRDALSDPKQLLKLLQVMSSDEHFPMFARNHALRLI
jgi:hypothetical protein